MREIEVKLFGIDADAVKRRLVEAGAKKIFDGTIDAVHLDYPDFRLRREGKQTRIRRIGDKTEIVVKGKRKAGDFADREEIETYVDDFETALRIFGSLGLEPMVRYTKHRVSYKLGRTKFEFDTFPNFPTFMEVEASTEEEVREGVMAIGCTMDQAYSKSIISKMEKEGIDPEKLGFKLSDRYDSWRKAT